MARIFIEAPNARRDLDLVALDAHGLDAIVEEPSKRALRLEAHQQHSCIAAPKPALEMVSDATCVAHAACSNNDVEAGEFRDSLAFIDRLGAAQMRRTEQPFNIDFGTEVRRI